ncbi:MAG TPA: plastocyanin/azurin family copper-binding protein [Solirubrobacteraceae bacterium]|jgi:plastocyanin
MQARGRVTKATPSFLACCCAIVLACGCGSSSGSSGGTSSQATTTGSALKSRLQPTTTPKYAAPPASAPVQGGTVQIAYRNIAIAPDTLKVKVGTTVRWTNYDPVEHNVTSRGGPASFASGNFGEGKSFAVKLTKPGVVHYLCTIHPTTMNGTIEVR